MSEKGPTKGAAKNEDDRYDNDHDFELMAANYFGKDRKFSHMNLTDLSDAVIHSNAMSVQAAMFASKGFNRSSLVEAPPELLNQWNSDTFFELSTSQVPQGSVHSSLAFNYNMLSSSHDDKADSNHNAINLEAEEKAMKMVANCILILDSNVELKNEANYNRKSSFFVTAKNSSRRRSSINGLSFSSVKKLKGSSRKIISTTVELNDIKNLTYISQGAMCNVYTGSFNKKDIIVKIPRQDSPVTSRNDLELEIVLLKELSHPNIVEIICAGTMPENMPFMGMEYLAGGNLSKNVSHKKFPYTLKESIDYALDIASTFQFLHEDAVPGHIILHRDLKPDNICFTKAGQLKIIDFGLAKVVRRKYHNLSEPFRMTGLTGSLRYMAPEVGLERPYNEKADVYSWSLVTWYILTRQRPFMNVSFDEFQAKVFENNLRPLLDSRWPAQLQVLLKDSWDKNYKKRPSFKVIVEALKGILPTVSSSTSCCAIFC